MKGKSKDCQLAKRAGGSCEPAQCNFESNLETIYISGGSVITFKRVL